jgi:putative transposase
MIVQTVVTEYHRILFTGTTAFFTVILAEKWKRRMLINRIDDLQQAFRSDKGELLLQVDAVADLPDQFHCV